MSNSNGLKFKAIASACILIALAGSAIAFPLLIFGATPTPEPQVPAKPSPIQIQAEKQTKIPNAKGFAATSTPAISPLPTKINSLNSPKAGAIELTGCSSTYYTTPGDYVITRDISATHHGTADYFCLIFYNLTTDQKFTVDCQGHTITLTHTAGAKPESPKLSRSSAEKIFFDYPGAPYNLFIGIGLSAKNIELKNCKFAGDWIEGFSIGASADSPSAAHDIVLDGVGARMFYEYGTAYGITGSAGGKLILVEGGTLRNSNIKNAPLSVKGNVTNSVFDDCLGVSGETGWLEYNTIGNCDGSVKAKIIRGNTFNNFKDSIEYRTGTESAGKVFDSNTFNNAYRPFYKTGGIDGDTSPSTANNIVNEFKKDQTLPSFNSNPISRKVSVDSPVTFTFTTKKYNGYAGDGEFFLKSKYPPDQEVSINGNAITATPRRPGMHTIEILYSTKTNNYTKKLSYQAVYSDVQTEEWASTQYVDINPPTGWQAKNSHFGQLKTGCAVAGSKSDSSYVSFVSTEADPYLTQGCLINSIEYYGLTKGISYQIGLQRFQRSNSDTDKTGATKTNTNYQMTRETFKTLDWNNDYNDINWLALVVKGVSVGVQQNNAWNWNCGHWTQASQSELNGNEVGHSRPYDNAGITLKFAKTASPLVINANRNVNFELLSATSNKAAKAGVNEYKVEFKSSATQEIELRFLSTGRHAAKFNGEDCTHSSSTCKILWPKYDEDDHRLQLQISPTGGVDSIEVLKG